MIIENNTQQLATIIGQAKCLLSDAAQALNLLVDDIATTVKIGGDMTVPASISAYQFNFSSRKTLLLGVGGAGQLPSIEIIKTIVQKQTHVLKKDRRQCIGIEFCGKQQQRAQAVYRQAASIMGLDWHGLVEQVGVYGLNTLPNVAHEGYARNLPQGLSLVGADTAEGYDYEASVHADKQIVSLREELLHSEWIDEYDENGVCGQRSMSLLLVAMHELVHVLQNKRASFGEKTLPINDDLWRHIAGLQQIYFEEIHAVLASVDYYQRSSLPPLTEAVLADEQRYIDKNKACVSGVEPDVIERIIDAIKTAII